MKRTEKKQTRVVDEGEKEEGVQRKGRRRRRGGKRGIKGGTEGRRGI